MKTNQIKLLGAALGAVVALSATTVFAADDSNRQDRMDQAYSNYRNHDAGPGPAARTESSMKHRARETGSAMKHGAHKTGSAIKHGAKATGHAVGTGMSKTGEFIDRGGDKLKSKTSP